MSQPLRSQPYNAPSKQPGGPEPPDPVERLNELKIELTHQQAKQTHITQQVTDLQNDINDLTTSVGDMRNILMTYGGQVKDLENRFHILEHFYHQKKTMVMAAIGDKKGPIDKLIYEFDEALAGMKAALDELAEKVKSAQQESDRAAALQAERQKEYDAVKAYKDDIATQLTNLESLRTLITAADDATDAASMYFLVLEFQALLECTSIISQHQLAMDLRHRLGELEAAKENARVKSAVLSTLQAELASQQAALDTKQAGRRQQLLAAIQSMYPVQAQPAPAPGQAAAAVATGAGGQAGANPAAPGAAPAGPAPGQAR
jgi:DNA repair exonuclease SbcCD ATPase subunit